MVSVPSDDSNDAGRCLEGSVKGRSRSSVSLYARLVSFR